MMHSISPNYDFTVYNMKEEPIVRNEEKYYGGEKSCYFSCEKWEPELDEYGEPKEDEEGNYIYGQDEEEDDFSGKKKKMIAEPVLIELQRHHFNTPNLPEIFGLGGFVGNDKELAATFWEPTTAELSQHDFTHRVIDLANIEIVFGTNLQKNTKVTYFGIGNVFSAFGGFLVSLKGVALAIYVGFFGALVKKQFASLLY